MQDFDHIAIEKLNLSRRTVHALARSGILTIGNLRQFYKDKDKFKIRNIGQKSLDEISKALNELPGNLPSLTQVEKHPVQLDLREDTKIDEEIQAPVDVLGLSPSIKGQLKKHGIKTIDDIRKVPDSVLLNINLIGPKNLAEIRRLLTKFVSKPTTAIVVETIKPPEKKPITWAEVVEGYFRNEKDVYCYILISRFGFEPKTLEEIATGLGVTRERVRQIQEAVAIRYLKYIRLSGAIGLLEKIEEIFSTYRDKLSLVSFESILTKEGLLGQLSQSITKEHIKNLNLLETLICWLNLLSNKRYNLQPIEFSVNISDLVRAGNVSISDHVTLLKVSTKQRRTIKRKVFFTGGITIKETMKILSADERIASLVLESLNLGKIDKEWFSLKNFETDKDNSKIPLRIAGLKMLAVNPEMEINTFYEGLRRHASRFYASIAPIHIISHILPLLGFEVIDSKVRTNLLTDSALSRSEKSLIAVIRKHEGVASFLEIAEEFFLQRLSLPSVSVTLKRSPIVEKADDGLYILRGTNILWPQIENARRRQKRFSQDAEITHGLDGIVRMKFTVSSYAFLTGVISSSGLRELSGSWSVVYDGKLLGEAKIDEAYLWGLAKLLKKLDVKMGERIQLALNTWNRTLSAEKVKNEPT
jgi:hypothetical protein